ncbi:hypothetical protein LXL04_029933 [Taraxacum kok-saghyz]
METSRASIVPFQDRSTRSSTNTIVCKAGRLHSGDEIVEKKLNVQFHGVRTVLVEDSMDASTGLMRKKNVVTSIDMMMQQTSGTRKFSMT